MTYKSAFKFWVTLLILILFFIIKILVLLNFIDSTSLSRFIEFACLMALLPLFWTMVKEYMDRTNEIKKSRDYREKLSKVLINQSHNPLFYDGDVHSGAKELTKNVVEALDIDKCSIWLYNEDKNVLKCEQSYMKTCNCWDIELAIKLNRCDHPLYFKAVDNDNIIIANDVHTHPDLVSFKWSNVNSVLVVPIVFQTDTIGIICLENRISRNWLDTEVDFAHMLSSLYTFAYSVKETNLISKDLLEFEKFIDKATLVSKTDSNGNITYINKKFEEVSGWRLKDLVGKNHKFISSNIHPKSFWDEMYKRTVTDKKIWNNIIINKTKKNELFYVDTYIKAEFDEYDVLVGYMTIRYDVTNLIKASQEIEKKNSYLEHAAKILRHDMHSGINTYMPRGISSLKRRLDVETIEKFKLAAPLRMLEEGLTHTQKVYKGVYEFTNLVKKDVVLNKSVYNLKTILKSYLNNTAYTSQVVIDDLGNANVNEPLFCTAVDNLIRNGLKYNDSDTKFVKIYREGNNIIIQDNGRGLTQENFELLSKPYSRNPNQKESGTGLGLNICVAILQEHKFKLSCEKNKIGTKMKIKL